MKDADLIIKEFTNCPVCGFVSPDVEPTGMNVDAAIATAKAALVAGFDTWPMCWLCIMGIGEQFIAAPETFPSVRP